MTINKINLRLKIFRKKFALKQTDVADVLGLNKQMVCYWEKGTHTPLLTHLLTLSERYNICFDYWIMEDDDKALTLLNGTMKGTPASALLKGNEFTILEQKHISIPYMETQVIKTVYSTLTACKQNALIYFLTGNAGIGKSVALKRCVQHDNEALHISIPYAGADIAHVQDLILRQMHKSPASPQAILSELLRNKKLLLIDNAHWIREDAFNILIGKLYPHIGLALCGENSIAKKFTADSINIPFDFEIERLSLTEEDIRKIAFYVFQDLSEDVYAAMNMRGYDSYFKLAHLKNTCDIIMEKMHTDELTGNVFYLADFYLMRRLRL
ncbi:MAG: helix-turn-helix domain-containing protein [Spirochaetales bacterium]|nr:helix-turn-helix domain-containing protein [Spirochaetales bacterium]